MVMSYNIFYSSFNLHCSDVVGDGVVVMGGEIMVGARPRVAVAHALALEIHVVIQVVSRCGLSLGIILKMKKIILLSTNNHLVMLIVRLEGGEDVGDTAPGPSIVC